MSGLSRRQFVVGAGASSVVLLAGCGRLPWQGQAQQPAKVRRIGFMVDPALAPFRATFREGLLQHGWIEGENVLVEQRWPDLSDPQFPAVAADLVALDPHLIVVAGAPAIAAIKNATSSIPIVMVAGGVDPVRAGLVASLARPGANVTGLTSMTPTLSGKRLELMRDLRPRLSHVAILWHPDASADQWVEMQSAADSMGLTLRSLEVRVPADLAPALDAAVEDHADALIVLPDPLTVGNQRQLGELATQLGLPAMHNQRGFVEAGGLMIFGPNISALFRRAAYYVDRILKGTKPADLPVEQPMTFDFVVNMKTAQALGITLPNEIMLQVTEVIQ